jgi:hypothetical protein
MKEIIDEIFKKRYNNDENSKSLSDLLNAYIESVFGELDYVFRVTAS